MEEMLQYLWEHRLWGYGALQTTDGVAVNVLDPGLHNRDAGPDFFNASVEIGGQKWVGTVEIHVRASDWYRHGHDADPAYDSVILHVVAYDDGHVYRRSDAERGAGSIIPQVLLRYRADVAERCERLADRCPQPELPCRATIGAMRPFDVSSWTTALGLGRLYRKSDRVTQAAQRFGGDWEQAAFVTLARALGFGLNSEPMERLALATPLMQLRKHADNTLAVEAMLLGQAGLVPPESPGEHPYTAMVRREHRFYAAKFSLPEPVAMGWKLARTRSQNFPHRRVAWLAQWVCTATSLVGSLEEAGASLDALRQLFARPLRGFWASHYTFEGASQGEEPSFATAPLLGRKSLDVLLINAAVPLLHALAIWRGDSDGQQRALDLLQELPAEGNGVVRLFAGAGVAVPDALVSQGLVELRREYCDKRKCIYCRIGRRMLAAEMRACEIDTPYELSPDDFKDLTDMSK